MTLDKCMTYPARRDFLTALAGRIADELMQTHPIDRTGLVADLPKAIESAVKRKEKKEVE